MSRTHIALFLVVAGCSTPSGDNVIDKTFDPCQTLVLVPAPDATDAEIASIDEAIALWADDGVAHLTRTPTRGAPELPIVFQEAAGAFHGVYEDEQGVVYINRQLTDNHARAVTISHEVGHAMGLFHVSADVRASVMNPGNLVVEPNPDDHAALTSLWGACSD